MRASTLLTAHHTDRLRRLVKEAYEIIGVVNTILLSGFDDCPVDDLTQTTNRTSLEKEIADLTDVINVMVACGDIHEMSIQQYTQLNNFSVKSFMYQQGEVSS